jgi:hypothetical protein
VRPAKAIGGGLLIGAVIFTCIMVLVGAGKLGSEQYQITQLSRQVASDRGVIKSQQADLTRAASVIKSDSASISGTHKDLLTCGDLIEVEENVSYSWNSDGTTGPVTLNSQWLPSHCYNQ